MMLINILSLFKTFFHIQSRITHKSWKNAHLLFIAPPLVDQYADPPCIPTPTFYLKHVKVPTLFYSYPTSFYLRLLTSVSRRRKASANLEIISVLQKRNCGVTQLEILTRPQNTQTRTSYPVIFIFYTKPLKWDLKLTVF